MHLAIRASKPAYRRLGFGLRPASEVVSESGRDRYDLVSLARRIVVELKRDGTMKTLTQIQRYLLGLRRQRPGPWTGHIVVSEGASRGLREAVRFDPSLRLWHCSPGRRGPVLEELGV